MYQGISQGQAQVYEWDDKIFASNKAAQISKNDLSHIFRTKGREFTF